jgi:ATP-dependent protease ClpP protease subunit
MTRALLLATLKRYQSYLSGAAPQAARADAPQGYGEPDVVEEQEEGRVAIRLYAFIDAHPLLELFGIPGSVAVSDVGFARALDRAKAMKKPIVLRINSFGGDVFAGIAIANMVKDAKLPVIVDSNAASIASVITAASPHVTMKPGATVMVHNPWTTLSANAKGLRAEAVVLDELAEAMLDIYVSKTGASFTRDQWRAALAGTDGADGSWLSAGAACEAGLADVCSVAEQDSPSAAMLEERRAAAALHGVKLPQSLAELPAQADPQSPKAPASGPSSEQPVAGRRVGLRKDTRYFYSPGR